MKKKYLILDTESNGPQRYAEIWQISWQTTDPHFASIKADGGFLEPKERMAHEAIMITGFTRKDLKKKAEPADGIYKRLLKDMKGCKAIIGHSVDIDIDRLINDSSRRCSPEVAAIVKDTLKAVPYYDTMAHSIEFVRKKIHRTIWYHGRPCYLQKLGYPGLRELANKLSVDWTGIIAHTADGDVELTRRCMVLLMEGHRELVRDLIHNKIVNPSTYYGWQSVWSVR